MTGTENTQRQREALTNGRREYARLVTEQAEKRAIREGRAYRDFTGKLQPAPWRNPVAKPHYTGHDYIGTVKPYKAPIVDTARWKALWNRVKAFGRRIVDRAV